MDKDYILKDEKGQGPYYGNWVGIIVFIIILLIVLRVLGLI